MKLEVKVVRGVGGEYRAWCPALPGCEVLADSSAKARQDIADAVRGYVASLNGSHPCVIACEGFVEAK